MSFGEHVSSLHASDLASGGRASSRGGRASPRGGEAEDDGQDTRHLKDENRHLRLCLMLMREQAELESANLISSVIAWCDDRFRKKFTEMSLTPTTRPQATSPFRPISPPVNSIALRIGGDQSTSAYGSSGSAFSNRTGMGSPLTTSQLVSRPADADQSHLVASSIGRSQSPAGNRSRSPTTGHRFSPTQSSNHQYQSSGTGTLSQPGSSGQAPNSFVSSGRISPLGNVVGRPPSPRTNASRPTFGSDSDRPASPRSTMNNASDQSVRSNFGPGDIASGLLGSFTNRPASPRSTFNNVPGRPPSPRSTFSNVQDRPPSPRSTFSNVQDRPPSPRFSHVPERPPSPRSTFSNVPERSPSPRSTFSNVSGRPPSPRSTLSNVPDRPPTREYSNDPNWPTNTFNSVSHPSASPRTNTGAANDSSMSQRPAFERATAPPVSPRPTSRSSSPHSFNYGSQQINPRTAGQSNIYNDPGHYDSRSDPNEEVSRRLHFNQIYAKFPRENEVLAAYNSPYAGRSNFTATLETQDLSATLPSLDRPESFAFIPSVHDTSLKGHKPHPPGLQQSLPQSSGQRSYSSQVTSATHQTQPDDTQLLRQVSPYGHNSFTKQQTPTAFSTAGPGSFQHYSSVQPLQPPSFAPQPSYHETSRTSQEQTGEPRSLTPFPEMHTRSLPGNMISIQEEMENELKSRGHSPVNINRFTEQLFGQPLAASTPKKARTSSPLGRKSPKRGKRTPSPKGKRSPSPCSDDSFKAQSRRSATNVKPSHRILGEIAFQLERRILDYVFARHKSAESRERGRRRFYGYTVSNIPFMIHKESQRHDGTIDDQTEFQLNYRLKYIITSLGPFGYELNRHGILAQEMINKYGLLSNAPDRKTLEAFGLADADTLREFVVRLASSETEKRDVLILLECLFVMAHDDGRSIFLW